MRKGALAAITIVLALVSGDAARADSPLHVLRGTDTCVAGRLVAECSGGDTTKEEPGLRGFGTVVLSPGDDVVYASGNQSLRDSNGFFESKGTITWFARKDDGTLARRGCLEGAHANIENVTDVGCRNNAAPVVPLLSIRALSLSPDGKDLYASTSRAYGTSTIVHFRRGADGGLTFADCIVDAAGALQHPELSMCTPSLDLVLPGRIAFSADGRDAYVGGEALYHLHRAADGTLGKVSCFLPQADLNTWDCTRVARVGANPVLSPDGSQLLSLSQGALADFARDATGALTYRGCISGENAPAPCTAVPGIFGTDSLSFAPDGTSVYLGGGLYSLLARFDRDPVNLTLGFAGCFQAVDFTVDRCGPGSTVQGIRQLSDLQVTGDGANLLVASPIDDDIVNFDRLPDGRILRHDCVGQGNGGGCSAGTPGLDGPTALALSNDGRDVYARSTDDQAIGRAERNLPPACEPVAVTAPADTAVTVPLDCEDPNTADGAPALRLGAPPAHGALGAIDLGARTVTYTPQAGFSGVDEFTFSARSGDGLTSGTTRAFVVVAPPAPTPTPTPAGDGTGTGAGSGAGTGTSGGATGGGTGGTGSGGSGGAPAPPARAYVFLGQGSLKTRRGRTLKPAVSVTDAGTLTITLRQGSRTVASRTKRLSRPGRTSVAMATKRKRKALPGGRYTLVATLKTADGRTATDSIRVTLTR